jgi:hypothetical protein
MQIVSGKAKTSFRSLKISFWESGQKSLSLKVNLTVEFAMSIVGVVTFSSLATMMLIQNFTTMIDKIKSVAVGVALVGRMVPNSIL